MIPTGLAEGSDSSFSGILQDSRGKMQDSNMFFRGFPPVFTPENAVFSRGEYRTVLRGGSVPGRGSGYGGREMKI
jgi:hypothetical protein